MACFLAGVKVGFCLPGAVLSCQVGPELLGRDLPLSFSTERSGFYLSPGLVNFILLTFNNQGSVHKECLKQAFWTFFRLWRFIDLPEI